MYEDIFQTTSYKSDIRVYTFDHRGLSINPCFIFKYLLKKFQFDVQTYRYGSNWLLLNGLYNKGKIVPMKKFFYDEFPLVKDLEFTNGSIKINFLSNVDFSLDIIDVKNMKDEHNSK